MQYMPSRLNVLSIAVATVFASAWANAQQTILNTVEVVGATPVAGVGVPRNQIPTNVQTVSGAALQASQAQNLPEFMAAQLPSVTVNEIQGNPYQVDVNYRGFTASPLLGTPQGLSVFLDGVRANEPFGDTVNWDLIPRSALASMDLIPGSNPVFGLNTLGGALSLRTKSGFTHPGGYIGANAGSFNRRNGEFAYGGNKDNLGWFVSGDWFKEDGWRDFSPSEVKQLFGKLSHKSAAGEVDLSLLRAQTNLIGNGLLPTSMFNERRESIYTRPDQTRNDLTQLTLSGRYFLGDKTSLSGSAYYRLNKTRTLNGDVNDEYAAPGDDQGVLNRTQTRQRSYGVTGQWNYIDEQHLFTVGASLDQSRFKFGQTEQEGNTFDSTRSVIDLGNENEANRLHGKTTTASIYLSETYSLSDALVLSASARYNHTHVFNRDQLNPGVVDNLDADYTYRKLNPSLGVTWQFLPTTQAYASLSQGNRAPTPIELGCANPANPCTLPNAMASDPYLKQVVSRTLEVGLRGSLVRDIKWNADVFLTRNTDDILFVGAGTASTAAGYFTNYGKTQRQGFELGLSGDYKRFDWSASYTYLKAQFKTDACLMSEGNSTSGDARCAGADEIFVASGSKMPNLPEHSFKIAASWRATDWLRLGGNVQAFSSIYVRGNENNQHQADSDLNPGKLPGYAILNLNASAQLSKRWEVLAKVNNVFDKRYATVGVLAENSFDAAGAFQANTGDWTDETFRGVGAPRSGWIGVRYHFDAK